MAGYRLTTGCTIRGTKNGLLTSKVVIDSGSPITAVDRKILLAFGEKPTGEYFSGIGGGLTIPAGNSVYQIYLKTDVSAERLTKVYASVNPFPEARILLGMDWLQTANPNVDWRSGVLSSGEGGQVSDIGDAANGTRTLGSMGRKAFKPRAGITYGMLATIVLVIMITV